MTRDKKIWVYNSGATFSGNPKYYFIYMNKYKKNVKSYWLCSDIKLVKEIRALGYKAYLFNSFKGKSIQKKAGVFVVNQAKNVFPKALKGCTILNLWHGVGCKTIEKKLEEGVVFEDIAKKYIAQNELYHNHQLFLVTSPLMEKHFSEQIGLCEKNIVRAGYPCDLMDFDVVTYDHDILTPKGLDKDTKIAIYCPTWRIRDEQTFFKTAFPDMESLHEVLKKKNMLLIFKLHPLMENDIQYRDHKEKYKNYSNFLFWNNKLDIYEVFNQIDLSIIDYSSIFYDMLLAGVPNYIRYIFDYDDKENVKNLVFDYEEMTCGAIAKNYDQLLKSIENYDVKSKKDTEEREKIFDLFWKYSNENSLEDIYTATMNFEPLNEKLPTLYSFDVFDTIIARKGLIPESIFYQIRDILKRNNEKFDSYFIENFVTIRSNVEANLREYCRKTNYTREKDIVEIDYEEIYQRIQNTFNITDKQKKFLIETELNCEFENCVGLEKNINHIRELLNNKEKVVFISDMYLPKNQIRKMITKVAPDFASVELYVSSDKNVKKTDKSMFYEVYKTVNYNFGEWQHFGDNKKADIICPKELGIKTNLIPSYEFNENELSLISCINNYDSHLVAALFEKYRRNHNETEYYSYSKFSLLFVPYIYWVIEDALKRKYETLYFISRDGHFLKIIADEIIKAKGLDIKTKYIYGSRKAWRVPSLIDEIDEEYFQEFGNINNGVRRYDQLLSAMMLTEEEFLKFFPYLSNLKNEIIDVDLLERIRLLLKESNEYRNLVLEKAAKRRDDVVGYIKQEIDFNEKFAFVEYWGRGYTQDCFTRLVNFASSKKIKQTDFYYLRSICDSNENNIRHNFSINNKSPLFLEAILANLPYDSISKYKFENGRYEPVINSIGYNKDLHKTLEETFIEFSRGMAELDFFDYECITKQLYDYVIEGYSDLCKPEHIKYIATLQYNGWSTGKATEYAPQITFKDLLKARKGMLSKRTYSKIMTKERSNKIVYYLYKMRIFGLKKSIKMIMKKMNLDD
jgi:Predicted hydrolase (HAD superfamily)